MLLCHLLQEAGAMDVKGERAAEAGASERQQELKTLAGVLPEGLRTALGLSMGQPVGHLKSSLDKGQLEPGLPAAQPAAVTAVPAAVPAMTLGTHPEASALDLLLHETL